MKFNRGLILSIFTIITLIINISQISSTKVTNKRSVVDFMKNFLGSDNTRKNLMGKLNNEISAQRENKLIVPGGPINKNQNFQRRSSNPRFKEAEFSKLNNQFTRYTKSNRRARAQFQLESESSNSTGTKGTPGLNTNTTAREETPNPILEEWYMISSKAFLDRSKFPPIITGNHRGDIMSFITDVGDFRVNGAYGDKNLEDKLPNNKFFYFRLSGLNIFYSSTKTDINILGAIHVDSMNNVLLTGQDAKTEYVTTCFEVQDKDHVSWKICGMNEKTVKIWFCQIKTFLNMYDPNNCPLSMGDPNVKDVVIHTTEVTTPIIIIPTASKFCNENWNYQQSAEDWECDCKEGTEQSPIDLPDINAAIDSTINPLMEYYPIKEVDQDLTLEEANGADGKIKLQYKENLLRIYAHKFGRIVTIDGAVYHAEEINIHCPSEHTIKGKKYDMEITILHSGVSVGDIAKSVSLSFLFERGPGKFNGFLEDLDVFDLPNPTDTIKTLKRPISIANILKTEKLDNDSALEIMSPFSFFTYQGSLTTPPCTEDTIVYVASEPLKIGSTVLQLIQEATRVPDLADARGNIILSNWINDTSRPTQPLNGRPIFHYDHSKQGCAPNLKPAPPKGHYEKIQKVYTSYFYVNNNKPSGLPSTYVVSEAEAKDANFAPVLRKAEKDI